MKPLALVLLLVAGCDSATRALSEKMRLGIKPKSTQRAMPQLDEPQLTVRISKDGISTVGLGEPRHLPKNDFANLARLFAELKAEHPQLDALKLVADDDVLYSDIIRTMDVAMAAKIEDIRLSDSTRTGASP
jgi:biopolymer transport protein ExbD